MHKVDRHKWWPCIRMRGEAVLDAIRRRWITLLVIRAFFCRLCCAWATTEAVSRPHSRAVTRSSVSSDPSLRVVSRRSLFEGNYLPDFDVAADGRLLVIETQPSMIKLVVVPNWISQLRN